MRVLPGTEIPLPLQGRFAPKRSSLLETRRGDYATSRLALPADLMEMPQRQTTTTSMIVGRPDGDPLRRMREGTLMAAEEALVWAQAVPTQGGRCPLGKHTVGSSR